jgi:putative NADH-flavin reductase
MKIVLYGASGMIGSRILAEALRRGHEVAGVTRDPERIPATPGVTARKGDATDPASVAETAAGADIAISAYGPGSGPQDALSANARALLEGLAKAGVSRVIVIGGAGSLEVAPGQLLADSPNFPAAVKPRALAQKAQLDIFRAAPNGPVTWTFVSPAAMIAPGERTGAYRRGGDQLLVDQNGQSKISAEDFAIAVLDEAEHPYYPNQRFTAAY